MPGSPATTYEEVTDEAAIRSALTAILPPNAPDSHIIGSSSKQSTPNLPLATALTSFDLAPFVHILTTRRTFAYSRYTPPLSIVLDHATPGPQCHNAGKGQDWRYALVEVEAVVDSEQMHDVDGADSGLREKWVRRIDEAADGLRLEPAGKFGGKVANYLRTFNPALLARLIEQNQPRQKPG